MNAFTKLSHTIACTDQLLGNNLATFKMPLLKASNLLEIFKQIEYLSGTTLEQAEKISQNLLSKLEAVSSFPASKDFISPDNQSNFKNSLNNILKLFKLDPIDGEEVLSDAPLEQDLKSDLPDLPDLPTIED